ncbi:Hypothetical predicted protein, partial [Pelobates cultripes]
MADHVQNLEEKVEMLETRIADAEDRARRNNLRLRGVPESGHAGHDGVSNSPSTTQADTGMAYRLHETFLKALCSGP